MSFPEEPLNLSPTAGGPGYFPATIYQKLSDGKYKIVRKLGYGPRSSTWLVFRESDGLHYAAKIFTVASSERASKVELPILQAVAKHGRFPLPVMQDHFWETGYHGLHLCVILNRLATSLEALQLEDKIPRLPVSSAQRIVYCTAKALGGLHSANIMHGAVNSGNVYFVPFSDAKLREPAPSSTKVQGFVTVRSQPLPVEDSLLPWRGGQVSPSEWPLVLSNVGHAQQSTFKPEAGNTYSFAPETLLNNPTCSPQTDIWMLGCMTFQLLTGQEPPFMLGKAASERLALMRGFLPDEEIPSGWPKDPNVKDMGRHVIADSAKMLEDLLSEYLCEHEASNAAIFIRGCLRLDPKQRMKASEYLDQDWLAEANACSCGYC